jgi:hypothetical protein
MSTKTRPARLLPAALLPALLAPAAMAQEAMYTAAATTASPGTFILREQFHFWRFGSDPRTDTDRTDRYELSSAVQIGLARGLSLTVETPVEIRDRRQESTGRHDTDTLSPDTELMLKWRFYQDDSGGIDTLRLALMTGVRFDTSSTDDFHADPHLGLVATKVFGRHGLNAEVRYTLTTGGDRLDNFGGDGPADAFNYNFAYVYRIFPDAYTSQSDGAWYITAELNGLLETNGDHDLRFSPGLMYEGRRVGVEIMAQLPVYSRTDERPRLHFGIGVGVRLLF